MCLLFFRKHQGCLARCVNVKVLISCNGSQARTSHSAGNTAAEAQQQGEGAAAGLRAAQHRGDQLVPEMPEGTGAGLGGWWHVGARSGVPLSPGSARQPRRAPQARALWFASLRGQRGAWTGEVRMDPAHSFTAVLTTFILGALPRSAGWH